MAFEQHMLEDCEENMALANPNEENQLSGLAVIIPIRSFANGKTRLGPIPYQSKAEIIRIIAKYILDAASPIERFVISSDLGVEAWATSLGVSTLKDNGDLNTTLRGATNLLYKQGYRRCAIVLGDIPLLRHQDVLDVLGHGDFAIITDRNHEGTNVMAFDLPLSIQLSYGRSSLASHRALIEESGAKCEVLQRIYPCYDIDTQGDIVSLGKLIRDDPKLPSDLHERIQTILSVLGHK
ncbi:hypothetical protein [Acidithrix sp. C25]|uniref:hypothetical protein n=1 Tax=Acidithrix sp. C25 TaxID=1671482 RepID=UPI00191BAB11|nr:hypothetical protein [Acidithrix sp. C25]